MKIKLISLILIAALLCLQWPKAYADCAYSPIYNGTLLGAYPTNAPPGAFALQPFLFLTSNYGDYTASWSLNKKKNIYEVEILTSLQTGITDWLDITLLLNGMYSKTGKFTSIRLGDISTLFGIQVMRDRRNTWIPDVRIQLGPTLPTGKYQKLNPKKRGSDASGSGAYEFTTLLIIQKIFCYFPNHPFNVNLNLYYITSTTTNVRNFNVYGGSYSTKGSVQPGSQFITNLGLEFSISQNWVIGTDIQYKHTERSTFQGTKGVNSDGIPVTVGLPSSELISVAPSLEYCFSNSLSLSWGVWFSIAGRNSGAFISSVFNVYYVF